MDDASVKRAEQMFHRTLALLKNGPGDFKPKHRVTPQSMACMGCCGISYFVIVTILIFFSTLLVTIPTVYEHDPESIFGTRCIACFLLFGISANFVLVCKKRSFYRGRPADVSGEVVKVDVCVECQQDLPSRVHHCPLCRRCVVKRDHHCFFTGCCVGYENQRYFLVYCLYCSLGCMYCLGYSWQYFAQVHGHPADIGYYNMVLPVSIVQWLAGYVSGAQLGAVALIALSLLTGVASGCIFIWQFSMALFGTTSYEFQKNGGLASVDWSRIQGRQNLRSVFGPYWILNFVFPMTFLKQQDMGMYTRDAKSV